MVELDENCEVEPGPPNWVVFWLGVAAIMLVMSLTYYLSHGAHLPKGKVTTAAAVTHILLGERVPPDDRIVALVRRRSGNENFNHRDLTWYKSRARRGKLRGQTGPHVIDQRVAKFHTIRCFGAEGVRI